MATWDDVGVDWDDVGFTWNGEEPFSPDVPYTPLPRVYIAPGYTWRDDPLSFVWREITPWVRSGEITMGRPTELDSFDAATCSLVLVDKDRTFDPANTSGPFYGSLVPNMPIKVEADLVGEAAVALTDSSGDELVDHLGEELTTDDVVDGAVTIYPRFYGYMDGLSITPAPANRVSYVTIASTDAFKLFAERPLASPYETAVLDLDPDLYWPLGTDGVALDRSGNGRHAKYVPSVQSTDRIAPFCGPGSRSVPIDEPVARVKEATWQTPLTLDTRVGVSFWFQANQQLSATPTLLLHFWPWFHVTAHPDDPRRMYVEFGDQTSSSSFRADIFDGAPHHIFIARDDAETWVYGGTPGSTLVASIFYMVYIDGVTTSPYGYAGKSPITAQLTTVTVGPSNRIGGAWVLDGAISDVSLHIGPEWTRDTPRELYETGMSPWGGDLPGERIHRVLDSIGWPAALRDIDPGEVPLAPADIAGTPALEHMQQVALTEGGRLFMSRDGKVTFHESGRFLSSSRETSVQVTFDDVAAPATAAVAEMTWRFDDEFVFDRAVVSRVGGRAQVAQSDPDPSRTKELSGLLMLSDRHAMQRAERIVWRYRLPQSRCDGWSAKPERVPGVWGDVLGLRFGDRVRLLKSRTASDTQDLTDLHLESASERFDSNEWVFTSMTGSPIDPHGYLRWDTGGGWDSSHWR